MSGFIVHSFVKIRDEYEVEIYSFDKIKKIFKFIRLIEYKKTEKHRISYILNNTHFEFDKYKDKYEFILEFLEIEARNIKTIYKFVELLGFKEYGCKPWTLSNIVKNVYNKEVDVL